MYRCVFNLFLYIGGSHASNMYMSHFGRINMSVCLKMAVASRSGHLCKCLSSRLDPQAVREGVWCGFMGPIILG